MTRIVKRRTYCRALRVAERGAPSARPHAQEGHHDVDARDNDQLEEALTRISSIRLVACHDGWPTKEPAKLDRHEH